ncbi:hemolysin XhlA family protein [Clostridium massiliamazoniense]|uniref:hemolysin XhlA family protein n=1 Tax=Clostridium massiliamazoniense TaxID=1347366 RepID=UPI0006D83E02|nr:hemolysin XhlA family protein [Clostridium massiliamazoniense]
MEDYKSIIEDHECRIRSLESNNIKLGDKLSNLCDKLDSLISSLKWLGVTFVGAVLSILIFTIEYHLK